MRFRAIVVDDEELSRSRLVRLLGKINVDVVAQAHNAQTALKCIKNTFAEVVFLDIQMPGESGIYIAKQIHELIEQPPAIIFCTAFDEFALDAYGVAASAYLLKPVTQEKLMKIIREISRINRWQNDIAHQSTIEKQQVLRIGSGSSFQQLFITEVFYIFSAEKHVYAYLLNGKEVLLGMSLKEVATKFSEHFIYCHRTYLVNKSHIISMKRVDKSKVILTIGKQDSDFVHLPVSRRYFPLLKQWWV